jgi:cysteine synthase
MIDLGVNYKNVDANAKRCKERGIVIPTFAQMRNPDLMPEKIKKELSSIGLWDVHPRNLFRITWKNEPKPHGGGFGGVNYMVLPSELTGVKAKIVALVGKWFPTGAHKVGATFGCLVPRLVTGQFDAARKKAVWPSTGNYCRGGAYLSKLLSCESIAILPEEMSRERFEWLSKIAGEVIATPGCESNVKEIFDKCWELRKTRSDVEIFNQFDELGNQLWHYNVTGQAMEEIIKKEIEDFGSDFAGTVLTSGSAGTTGSGYYLKDIYPKSKLAVSEALQCPTLLNNGFGGHRIEGIGDKHVPWIHDMKQTDMVLAIDDEHTIRLIRLFNEEVGKKFLNENGVSKNLTSNLHLLGISSVANLLSSIKFAKYYELKESDLVFTVFTDSMELYDSRLKELESQRGKYSERDAICDYECLMNQGTDNLLELSYVDRKRVHNLKYYTWIEQQAKSLDELNSQWYDHKNYWKSVYEKTSQIDELIEDFNKRVEKI